MKRICLYFLLISISFLLFAQEGEAYKGSTKVFEKRYSIDNSYGLGKMKLEAQCTSYYNSEGFITETINQRGNLTYQGKRLINYSSDPDTKETLYYNSMNILNRRTIKESAPELLSETTIFYDDRGKILSKVETRSISDGGELWELSYNQVGYVANYYHITKNDMGLISEKKHYDYFHDLIDTAFYAYEGVKLTSIRTISAEDSLISKDLFAYDEMGNLLEETRYNHSDIPLYSHRYSYDQLGRITHYSYYIYNPRFGVLPQLKEYKEYVYE